MASPPETIEIVIPPLPAKHDQFIEYLAEHPKTPMHDLLEPYKQYDTELRKVFAQQPDHPAAKQPNIVPVFAGHEHNVTTRARNLDGESREEIERYIMPLKHEDRRSDGSPAIVQSLPEFKTNFNVFSESSLVDLDWSNVVVAGSAVVTSLLAVPEKYADSKRSLRQYFHEKIAPASDVDLFLYGLTEEQAVTKIKQIEQNVRDALLVETTTIRTKNTITIASRHPVRHVQIVLRIYRNISEILTGFDVDCSCVAYDGSQVYASPRALASYMTQINTIDLTRRSPSYENRLSKYAHRGFEVYWPSVDRSRVDPTIFERSFGRTEGLARLLILEKLPKSDDRDAYLDQRRAERGRPAVNRYRMRRRRVPGNIKNDFEDEIAEWDDGEASDYHSIAIPYGPKYHARKIEKLLYSKDLLLNAEWNKPKDREVNLHRHPAFFGTVEDVIQDCCGFCPKPTTLEKDEIAEEERKTYVCGHVQFVKDDPGRQAIGSFNPLTPDDWTAMAYVGNTALLCHAIVDGDSEYVATWLEQDGNDPNTRDYTGRTPLHLAVANSTTEVVQVLIDHGARLVARLADGKTALHLAAIRGSVEMVSALLRKSEANEEEEAKKLDARCAARKSVKHDKAGDILMGDADQTEGALGSKEDDSDVEMISTAEAEDDEDMDATTENSLVNIKPPAPDSDDRALANEDTENDPDIYSIDVVSWDIAVSPLHLAVVKGHTDVVKVLVQEFGADVLMPIKLFNEHDKSPRAAILTLVLALQLPFERAEEMARLLIQLGASSAQASIDQTTALQSCVGDRPDLLDTLANADATGVARAINHLSVSGYKWSVSVNSPLMIAIQAKDSLTALRLLTLGAKPEVHFAAYMKAYQTRHDPPKDSKQNKRTFEQSLEQPVLTAVKCELPLLAKNLIEEHGVDANTLTIEGYRVVNDDYSRRYTKGKALLDEVHEKLKLLREWEYKVDEPDTPLPLNDDRQYLSGFKQDSYALWSAQKQLNAAKDRYTKDLTAYNERREEQKDQTGVPEKQEAIQQAISDFEQLETAMLNRGAKRFKDLHPEVEEPEKRESYSYNHQHNKPKPFAVEFGFQLGDLNEESQQRYERLFEAAWHGNIAIIKELALHPWKDDNGDDQPPSRIAVQDQHGLSPFSIAILRDHFEAANAMMDIANAQHVSADPPKQRSYEVDSGDDDEIQLYSEIVDNEFTIDTVGEVSLQVKSRVLPIEMMQWRSSSVADFAKGKAKSVDRTSGSGFSYFGPRKQLYFSGKRTNTGSISLPSSSASKEQSKRGFPEPMNLLQFAVCNNNAELLQWLLQLGKQYFQTRPGQDDDSTKQAFTISDSDFEYALETGHAHLIAEIIKYTGAGLPLDALAKKYGADLKEKPKYYQGLSVYGKKRKDWADAGRTHMGMRPAHNERTPLLSSCYLGSMEAVEWFLSDTPMRCYKEFEASNREDKSVQRLALSSTGFESTVQTFLDKRSYLAMHCYIMGNATVESDGLLHYLLRTMPDTLEAKSIEGFTPLHIAFELYRDQAAKLLIEANADQTCRDKLGRNILHSALSRYFEKDEHIGNLRSMLDLVDRRVLPTLFVERSTGSLTPLHYFLLNMNCAEGKAEEVLKTILEYGGGEELSFISGEGDTPLHRAVKTNHFSIVRVIVDHDPALINRENATGRTPHEMAEDADLAEKCSDPPPMPNDHNLSTRRAKRYGLHEDWAMGIIDRSPKSFVEPVEAVEITKREKIWKLLQETKAKLDAEGKSKRRLVTLNEANEVARRLAAMKSSIPRKLERDGRDSGEGDEEERNVDEVQEWLSAAKARM